MCAGGIAPKRTGRQRDGIVGSRRPGAELTSTKCAYAPGSSRVFSREFWDSSFMRSASTITNTRRRDSNGRSAAWRTIRVRTSSTRISCAPRGSTHVRSGCTPDSTRRSASAGSSDPAEISAAAKALRGPPLAAAGRPVEEVRVRERGLVAQARLERDARAGLVLECLERHRRASTVCTTSA